MSHAWLSVGNCRRFIGAAGCAPFGIVRAKDDAVDPAMDDCPGAHGAGFLGNVKSAAGEAPIAHRGLGGSQGDHLGMGGGVFEQFHLIPGAGDDPPSRTTTAPTGTSSAS